MEPTVGQLILSRLDELSRDVRANTEATQGVVTANAVLTERVDNLCGKVEDHLEDDEQFHADSSKKIEGLDKWRTELKTKIATYAAVAGAVCYVVIEFGKSAIGAAFAAVTGGGGVPH